MRKFFTSIIVAISFLLASVVGSFAASDYVNYTPSVLAKAEQSGKPYLLDFYAEWCSTCRTQDRVLGELQNEDAKLKAVKIIRVDWDAKASQGLIKTLGIPRRSTLVMFKGTTELDRLVAQTSKSNIRKLLELGL